MLYEVITCRMAGLTPARVPNRSRRDAMRGQEVANRAECSVRDRLPRGVWLLPPSSTPPVITSYSIHYTKLYDVIVVCGKNGGVIPCRRSNCPRRWLWNECLSRKGAQLPPEIASCAESDEQSEYEQGEQPMAPVARFFGCEQIVCGAAITVGFDRLLIHLLWLEIFAGWLV